MTNDFAALRLLPMSGRDKGVEILVLRHQITVLERQLGPCGRVRFAGEDRVFLAAVLAPLPREVLHWLRLPVRPDTVLRWHHEVIKQRHAHAVSLRTRRVSSKGIPKIVARGVSPRLAHEDQIQASDLSDAL
ncbi:hypothetical protein J5X84_38470 [Streptosporangiaceae bacterium NEAU-GS5]|nr:hypothetical protein [Streptosporangiaceae bacterium NEAU-GS5]